MGTASVATIEGSSIVASAVRLRPVLTAARPISIPMRARQDRPSPAGALA